MSLNISELLNPPSPAPPHPQPVTDSPSSTNTHTTALPPTSHTSQSNSNSPSRPPDSSSASIMTPPSGSRHGNNSYRNLPSYKVHRYDEPPHVAGEEAGAQAHQSKTRSTPKLPPKRLSGHGSSPPAFPVEPSPPLERTPTSPTLEHYHHPSGEAEIKRRQSFAAARTSPPPVLAPIQSPIQTVASPTMTSAETYNEGKEADRHGLKQKKDVSIAHTGEETAIHAPGDSQAGSEGSAVKAGSSHETLDPALPVDSEESIQPIAPEDSQQDATPTAKQVAGLKRDNSRASSTEMSTPARATPTPKASASTAKTAGTKRKAPSSGRKIEKKGIAKPSLKKRKLDDDDAASSTRRTGSPASSHASKTPAPKANTKQSHSVASSPPAEENDDVNMDDDDDFNEDEVFCICRKPDDHSWMIACDGGCDDWFHGKCVDMKEQDGDLIDKYICPNCMDAGRGVTTWKPMCRLASCRKPARVTGQIPSKYCSDEHGREFMRASLRRSGYDGPDDSVSPSRRRRKMNYTDNMGDDDSNYSVDDKNDMDYEEESRGGVLKAGELKAVINSVKNAEEFRRLGEGVLSPSNTSPENGGGANGTTSNQISTTGGPSYTPAELITIEKNKTSRALIDQTRARLQDREKFLNLVRHRGKAALEMLKAKDKSVKDICGFDSRVSWSDDEFDAFRASKDGIGCLLENGPLPPPASELPDPKIEDPVMEPLIRGVCRRKKCVQHTQWIRIFQEGFREEARMLREEEDDLEREEKGVKERAVLRGLEGKS